MEEHASEVISLLTWMIVVIGGSLLSLLIWTGKRIQKKVDEIPSQVAIKVDAVHKELLEKVDEIKSEQRATSKDIQSELAILDRRVLKLELRCEATHRRSPGE